MSQSTISVHPSHKGQQILQVLQQPVDKALEKKWRLGQYAVVWQNGAPVKVWGKDMAKNFLLAEKTFLERLLPDIPESAQLTRMSTLARLKKVETSLANLNDDQAYVEILRQRLESADRGEFASDEEADAFFAKLDAR